jgi:hypothetical protein
MSFYPILKAPGCQGWTTLHNYSANNWEPTQSVARHANLTWSDGANWHSTQIAEVADGQAYRVNAADIAGLHPAEAQVFLSLTRARLPSTCDRLPSFNDTQTTYPFWRATLGLTSEKGAETSYQGEIDPFPSPGSLLTFGYLQQYAPGIWNYFLFLNLESSPNIRKGILEIRRADSPEACLHRCEVMSNSITMVPLDNLGVTNDDLPLIICREMSGIPLYFSVADDGTYLSLEHTHPPASTVVLGQRWQAQKIIKQFWLSKAHS